MAKNSFVAEVTFNKVPGLRPVILEKETLAQVFFL